MTASRVSDERLDERMRREKLESAIAWCSGEKKPSNRRVTRGDMLTMLRELARTRGELTALRMDLSTVQDHARTVEATCDRLRRDVEEYKAELVIDIEEFKRRDKIMEEAANNMQRVIAEREALRSTAKALGEALEEAIAVRVALYRHSDMLDEDAHLSDTQVVQKDVYASRWNAALAASAKEKP